MKRITTSARAAFAGALWAAVAASQFQGAAQAAESAQIARGRYLARIAGCNDCHTAGYAESGGAVAESAWLTGSPVGWQGPWGTTYPGNLRLLMQRLSEREWLLRARQPLRPPMPWFALRDMSDADLKSIYRFVRSLGPAGEPSPAFVPPGRTPPGPYFDFVPRNLPVQTGRP